MLAESALAAFQTASGVAPAKLSLFIRTLLLSLMFVWAGWSVNGLIHHLRHRNDVDYDAGIFLLRVLFIVTIMLILVFIA